MEYTKEKWKVGATWKSLNCYVTEVLNEHGQNIVSVVSFTEERSKANAQLVASAPDLYEACKQAQEGIGDWRGVIDLALAKTEGK